MAPAKLRLTTDPEISLGSFLWTCFASDWFLKRRRENFEPVESRIRTEQ